jgi:hypothetical protein
VTGMSWLACVSYDCLLFYLLPALPASPPNLLPHIHQFARAKTPEGAQIIIDSYSVDWPVRLGRVDSTTPGPEGRIPSGDASVADVKVMRQGRGNEWVQRGEVGL